MSEYRTALEHSVDILKDSTRCRSTIVNERKIQVGPCEEIEAAESGVEVVGGVKRSQGAEAAVDVQVS